MSLAAAKLVILGCLLASLAVVDGRSPSRCRMSQMRKPDIVEGQVEIDTSPMKPFQWPAISAFNSTAWENWHFDGVAQDGTSALAVTFSRGTRAPESRNGILPIMLNAVWPNGTSFSKTLYAEHAMVEECVGATYGIWDGRGFESRFEVARDSSQATILINSTDFDAELFLTSISKPRYANGLVFPDAEGSVAVVPLIYRNEAIPAGRANAEMKIVGELFSFEGIGGSDRTWAPFPRETLSDHWWWTRAVTGPYTLGFWNFTSAIDNSTYVGAYLDEDGESIFRYHGNVAETCSGDCVRMTLLNDDRSRLNRKGSDKSTGFRIELQSGTSGEQWEFEIQHSNIVFENVSPTNEYWQFANTAKGGAVGREMFRGAASSEQSMATKKGTLPWE
ncbi:hypothetical protein AJ80_05680 [Polytolypa hystricis UAMH7299]|uniref:AttH domain-containing protein n=1 Tax=Polytolypa hystricis (strain UAMH7299) TaxID=1447883 RepID=A0A2B7Y1I2_POLH7|nr:hypothetical protein AJ80_05680 [Polytolypa hystricis UAMH7299]